MIRNYFRVAVRNILRHKGYSFINVTGLALGLASCLIIMLWVIDEFSYDRFHEKAEHLYRVEQDQFYSGETYHVTVTPYPMGAGIKEEIPEIVDAARYVWMGTQLLRYADLSFYESGVRAVDPSFLKMFRFSLVRGDSENALEQPRSIVITEEMATKYFGDEDPIGKTLVGNIRYNFTVAGVLKKLPKNSYFEFDMLVPFEFLREIGRYSDNWGSNSIITMVQLSENASVQDVNTKITDTRHRHVAESLEDDAEGLERFNARPKTQFMLMPLKDIRLYSYFGYGRPMGAIQYVTIFVTIAGFILLIASINFMTLATARSSSRAKEVGMRKVVGAMKSQLVRQFYGESILLAFIALVFGIGLVAVLLPRFNLLSGKELTLGALLNWRFLAGMFIVTFLTGFVSGSYPALFLSSFRPVRVLKGGLSAGAKSALFRKVLVLTQFSLSILLIVSTVFINKQLHFMQSKKLGYDKEHVVYLPLRGDTIQSYGVLKDRLRQDPHIVNASGTNHPPTSIGSNSGGADWEGKDPNLNVLISQNAVDFDYIETMRIEMAEGRPFLESFSTDTSTAFLVNEEVVRIMGVASAVDNRFRFQGTEGTIVGVMKNFHFQSVRYEIEPLAIYCRPQWMNYLTIRLAPGDMQESLDVVKSIWESTVPNYPFEYRFLDQDFDRMYRGEVRLGSLLQTFTILAIVVACLGLFGLASFTAEQRTKEIGIRKVLGASVPGVMVLLAKEFVKWVCIANAIAWPIAYFILRSWLQDYAYRAPLSWWVFAGSGILALVVALLTVSYQSVRAALANPVDSLRYE
ncbi:MAG: ABC transporter permease [bacterium]